MQSLVEVVQEKNFEADDVQYMRDLGLLAQKSFTIANPIYQEILPRALSSTKEETFTPEQLWYMKPEKTIDMFKLLEAFTQFYRENSEVWLNESSYIEAGPHLLLMAFLQRIINGGGTIHREYGLGTQRVDIFIKFGEQRIVLELKNWYGPKTLLDGLEQTAGYMDTSNAPEGHLIIFDRKSKKKAGKKKFISDKNQ